MRFAGWRYVNMTTGLGVKGVEGILNAMWKTVSALKALPCKSADD